MYLHPAVFFKFSYPFFKTSSLVWKHAYIHTYTWACLCIINFFLIPEVTYIEMKPTYPSFHSRFFILCHSSTRRPVKWVTGFIFITPTSQRLILERTFWQQSPKQKSLWQLPHPVLRRKMKEWDCVFEVYWAELIERMKKHKGIVLCMGMDLD